MAETIGRRHFAPADREYQRAQQPGDRADREVAQHAVERVLHAPGAIVERPGEQRLVGQRPALVLVALEHRTADVQVRQNVAEARRQLLLELELAAER